MEKSASRSTALSASKREEPTAPNSTNSKANNIHHQSTLKNPILGQEDMGRVSHSSSRKITTDKPRGKTSNKAAYFDKLKRLLEEYGTLLNGRRL